jgi:hypothetical protein
LINTSLLTSGSADDWLLRRIAFLNLDNESNFLIAMSSLFHSLTVEGINDELVIESLQKGTIKLSSDLFCNRFKHFYKIGVFICRDRLGNTIRAEISQKTTIILGIKGLHTTAAL